MFKTRFFSPKDITRDWFIIDAKDQNLGKISSKISKILIGKHKSNYSSNLVFSDHVVVINAKHLKISEKKMSEKLYYTHSGYPGGLHEKSLKRLLDENPTFVLYNAIGGMLPKNKLKDKRMKYLHIFADNMEGFENIKFIDLK
jgi:large subunit ribosomal protein L13